MQIGCKLDLCNRDARPHPVHPFTMDSRGPWGRVRFSRGGHRVGHARPSQTANSTAATAPAHPARLRRRRSRSRAAGVPPAGPRVIGPTRSVRVFAYGSPADMRKGSTACTVWSGSTSSRTRSRVTCTCSSLGGPDGLRQLVNAAHQRGFAVPKTRKRAKLRSVAQDAALVITYFAQCLIHQGEQ